MITFLCKQHLLHSPHSYKVPLYCSLSFSCLFRRVIQLPGRPTVVYMFCIQSEYSEWSTGAMHPILFHQPLIHHCPHSILYHHISLSINSFSFQSCGWLRFCVYVLDDTHIYTLWAHSTGLLPIQEKNPFPMPRSAHFLESVCAALNTAASVQHQQLWITVSSVKSHQHTI